MAVVLHAMTDCRWQGGGVEGQNHPHLREAEQSGRVMPIDEQTALAWAVILCQSRCLPNLLARPR